MDGWMAGWLDGMARLACGVFWRRRGEERSGEERYVVGFCACVCVSGSGNRLD